MDSYGVVQVGNYLLSVPGAVIYISSLYIMIRLAKALSDGLHPRHFRFTRFSIYSVVLLSLMTLLWVKLGVWFYVEA